jgi:ADP-heptose:LPS heptosyltransferase
MKRHQGEGLPDRPRAALISNDALGNFAAVTPLMQMLHAAHPGITLDYYAGTRIAQMAEAYDLASSHYSIFGTPLNDFLKRGAPADYDLVINVESSIWAKTAATLLASENSLVVGAALTEDGRAELPFADDEQGRLNADTNWIDEHLASRYEILDTGWISEIFCRLTYLEGPVPPPLMPEAEPEGDIPDVLMSTSASLDSKLWPDESWAAVTNELKNQGHSVGILGAKPSYGSKFWSGGGTEQMLIDDCGAIDLRGKFTLPEAAGALRKAKQVVTLDNGILHFAASVKTPTVGLFRHGIHRLWAPPVESVSVLEPGPNASVKDISVKRVLDAVRI